jgi:hypothetical protein
MSLSVVRYSFFEIAEMRFSVDVLRFYFLYILFIDLLWLLRRLVWHLHVNVMGMEFLLEIWKCMGMNMNWA